MLVSEITENSANKYLIKHCVLKMIPIPILEMCLLDSEDFIVDLLVSWKILIKRCKDVKFPINALTYVSLL